MAAKRKAKGTVALLREYNRVMKAMQFCDKFEPRLANRFQELYGVQQALAWALGMNAMAPVRCAMLGIDSPFWWARERGKR